MLKMTTCIQKLKVAIYSVIPDNYEIKCGVQVTHLLPRSSRRNLCFGRISHKGSSPVARRKLDSRFSAGPLAKLKRIAHSFWEDFLGQSWRKRFRGPQAIDGFLREKLNTSNCTHEFNENRYIPQDGGNNWSRSARMAALQITRKVQVNFKNSPMEIICQNSVGWSRYNIPAPGRAAIWCTW